MCSPPGNTNAVRSCNDVSRDVAYEAFSGVGTGRRLGSRKAVSIREADRSSLYTCANDNTSGFAIAAADEADAKSLERTLLKGTVSGKSFSTNLAIDSS